MAGPSYQFGIFHLDPDTGQLLSPAGTIPLAPKVFETLRLLVENRGKTVSKDELLNRIWPDAFVEENSLAHNISVLRRALGDGENGSRFILTVPKRGYRFVAEVQEVGNGAREFDAAATTRSRLAVPISPRAWWSAGLIVLSILAASATVYLVRRGSPSGKPGGAGRVMLAVLPVQNLSGDPEREFISDGLTEEMIAQLGSLNPQRLGVIARTSSMAYKKTDKTVDQIGRELGVDYVLESSIRGSGDKIRVTAQLIRTSDQTHLWAQDYNHTDLDIVALQDEVSQAVASQIRLKLAPQQRLRLSTAGGMDPQAYQDYLRGRFQWNQRTQEGFMKARSYFEHAIEKDPGHPLGYAGLADAYIGLSSYDVLPAKEAIPRSKAAAKKAIELDDSIAETHTALANSLCEFDWDVPAAEKEFKRAIELNPSYATAHQWYGECMLWVGRIAESDVELKRAKELDPLSPIITRNVGLPLFIAGRYDEFIEFSRKMVEIDPNFWGNYFNLAWAFEKKREFTQAIANYEKANKLNETSLTMAHLVHVYAVAGRNSEAESIFTILKARSKHQYIPPFLIAYAYEGSGDKDQALNWLEKAYEERYWLLISLKTDPRWENLRSDPRFQDLERRVGLSP